MFFTPWAGQRPMRQPTAAPNDLSPSACHTDHEPPCRPLHRRPSRDCRRGHAQKRPAFEPTHLGHAARATQLRGLVSSPALSAQGAAHGPRFNWLSRNPLRRVDPRRGGQPAPGVRYALPVLGRRVQSRQVVGNAVAVLQRVHRASSRADSSGIRRAPAGGPRPARPTRRQPRSRPGTTASPHPVAVALRSTGSSVASSAVELLGKGKCDIGPQPLACPRAQMINSRS